ncbi:hypothetical protein ACWPKS_08415 [Coraliomargarita sp. W4R72]
MSEDTQQPIVNAPKGVRYSLKEMMEEVAIDRRDSVFGRELVDSTEIEKMFSKKVRKKKKK